MNSQFNSAVFVACMNAEYEAFGRSKVYLRGMNAVLDCNDSNLAYAVASRMNGITENTNSLVDSSSNIYVEDSAMNLRSGMYVCFGEDCTNIIHVLVECGLIESADELEYVSDDIYY